MATLNGNLLSVGYETIIQKAGPMPATAVAIAAGTILESIPTTRTVQAASDGATNLFYGVADRDYAASATDVIGLHDFEMEIASAAAHDDNAPAYAVAGGLSVTAVSSLGPCVGYFVGLRNATTGKSKVRFLKFQGPALS